MVTRTKNLIVLKKELIFSLEHLPVWAGVSFIEHHPVAIYNMYFVGRFPVVFCRTLHIGGYFVEHLPV